VHPDVERLMAEEIRAALKISADIGVDDLLPLIQDAAESLGVPPPGQAPWVAAYGKRVVGRRSSLLYGLAHNKLSR